MTDKPVTDAAIERAAAVMVKRDWLPAGWKNKDRAPVGDPATIRKHIREFLEAAQA